jgi:hypothetical protein
LDYILLKRTIVAAHNYKNIMPRRVRFAALYIPLICLLSPQLLYAETDAMLDQIQGAWTRRGAEGYRQAVKSFGHAVREEQGQILVPVIVERKVSNRTDFTPRLKLAGARVDSLSRSYARILVPINRLAQLVKQFPAEQLRGPLPVYPVSFGLGPALSESVSLSAADGYQVGNLNGTGVRVAVVDLGFSGLTNAINTGELPANTIVQDFTGTGLETGTKHGTGVAEHVLDMAPGATLYCIKVGDQADLQNAADYIRTNNIKIANHSAAWVLASYYDDTGPINSIINGSHDTDGVFWSIAAGNQARQHWRGSWVDADGNNTLEFKNNDELMALSGTAASVSVYLNWNQYGVNNKTNLNLYVLNNAGTVVASSTTAQSQYNDPVEAVSFTYVSSQAPYSVKVTRTGSGSTTGLDITVFSFSHYFEHNVVASSILDPASAHGAFTVGAVNQSTWLQTIPPIESFSSQGPSTDGRQKPDLVAPDGTSSLTYGTRNSYGTSFSAPTVAGAAALLLQETTDRTALAIADLLRTTATDIGSLGADPTYGYGKLQLPLIDSDGDQLTNKQEIGLGTNALSLDTDADGLSDYAEAVTYATNPLLSDTDTDGLTDYFEVITYGTNPLASNRGDLAPRGQPDGVIDAGDSVVLSRLATGSITPSSAELSLGDLNDNGGLDAGDMVVLMRAIQGLITLP